MSFLLVYDAFRPFRNYGFCSGPGLRCRLPVWKCRTKSVRFQKAWLSPSRSSCRRNRAFEKANVRSCLSSPRCPQGEEYKGIFVWVNIFLKVVCVAHKTIMLTLTKSSIPQAHIMNARVRMARKLFHRRDFSSDFASVWPISVSFWHRFRAHIEPDNRSGPVGPKTG